MHQNKVALITGAGSGIGAAAAMRLASDGAAVAVVDLRSDTARRTVELIEGAGGRAIAIAADISSEADNARMFDEAEAAFGGAVDYAFLNAGILQEYVPFDQVSLETFDRVMGVNLRGVFLGMKQAQARLRSGGACVVTSSAAGYLGFADAAAYSASKHGVIGLVRSAARDFAARGLRVNAICPGMVNTPLIGAAPVETIVAPADLPEVDYRGGLQPQQVAEVALFLLSRQAVGVNGQAQLVDAALLSAFPPLD